MNDMFKQFLFNWLVLILTLTLMKVIGVMP